MLKKGWLNDEIRVFVDLGGNQKNGLTLITNSNEGDDNNQEDGSDNNKEGSDDNNEEGNSNNEEGNDDNNEEVNDNNEEGVMIKR